MPTACAPSDEGAPELSWPVDNPTPKVQRPMDLLRSGPAHAGEHCRAGGPFDIDHAVGPSAMFAAARRRAARAARFPCHGSSPLRRPSRRSQRARRGSRLWPWPPLRRASSRRSCLRRVKLGPPTSTAASSMKPSPGARCPTTSVTSTQASHARWHARQGARAARGHEADSRPVLYRDDELEYGAQRRTWNAAQGSTCGTAGCTITWDAVGKAVLQWTLDAAECPGYSST